MKKNVNGKKLSLNVETLRDLNPSEKSKAVGGLRTLCWTSLIPSSGLPITIYTATTGGC
jgi:hypothetical protein